MSFWIDQRWIPARCLAHSTGSEVRCWVSHSPAASRAIESGNVARYLRAFALATDLEAGPVLSHGLEAESSLMGKTAKAVVPPVRPGVIGRVGDCLKPAHYPP